MSLKITEVKKIYGEKTVLNISELEIKEGEIVGIVGNNGAGKSTFLQLLLDLVQADSGTVFSKSKNIAKNEAWKSYTSAYLGDSFLIKFLTPEEYFHFIANSYQVAQTTLNYTLDSLKSFMNGEILNKNKYIRDFSSGNQQKIGIIGSLITNPEILILDEPFNFLDPTSQNNMQEHIYNFNKKNNSTIIISSHNIECILKVATRILLLEDGVVINDSKTINGELKNLLITYFKEQK